MTHTADGLLQSTRYSIGFAAIELFGDLFGVSLAELHEFLTVRCRGLSRGSINNLPRSCNFDSRHIALADLPWLPGCSH
ncbi:hypothetical protein [Neorhizobium sp. P12A]|uniref:hypothetical protein n=1 Tax=Neorhizobium sp. P12A TaxID=2268027 RepID=UPI00165DB855|nr:hypothetical protein [Neorhizobium sp. P12A]